MSQDACRGERGGDGRRLPTDPDTLLARARDDDRVALAKLLSRIERGGETGLAVAHLAYRAAVPYTVGMTGAPGAGKSTLTDKLIVEVRAGWPAGEVPRGDGVVGEGEAVAQVGVLAVDPSSPFSGGAILADRVRMGQHALDPTVFIRSMATRGHLGGLSLAVPDAIRLLGAAGLPVVIVETVGVGQMEVEIASAADTTIVVVTPGWGDAMQANKAGLLEIADVFVINKADRPGVREARRDLQQMLDLSRPRRGGPRSSRRRRAAARASRSCGRRWRGTAPTCRTRAGSCLGARTASRRSCGACCWPGRRCAWTSWRRARSSRPR